jgi:5-methylcytosine-specific restriction endonuclease McrA
MGPDHHDPSGSAPPATNLPRRERLRLVLERDGAACVWCRRLIDTDLVRATTEHVVPRIKGGPSWLENEVAACARCNRERGHRTPADWIDECERRGWEPDVEAVVRALTALQEAIAERGGQRRARPYVATQLRRLDRLDRGR